MTAITAPTQTATQSNTATLLLVTIDPTHPTAMHAYRYAAALLEHHEQTSVRQTDPCLMHVFFYGEAAHTANRLRWQTADQTDLTALWQQLHQHFGLRLPVCVSTALTRGITDSENAQRHHLAGNNLADGFELVGLGDLVQMLDSAQTVIQF